MKSYRKVLLEDPQLSRNLRQYLSDKANHLIRLRAEGYSWKAITHTTCGTGFSVAKFSSVGRMVIAAFSKDNLINVRQTITMSVQVTPDEMVKLNAYLVFLRTGAIKLQLPSQLRHLF